MNIPACNKYGHPKNLNPCKKNYRRRRFPNYKTWVRFYSHKSREEKLKGVNPEFADLFL